MNPPPASFLARAITASVIAALVACKSPPSGLRAVGTIEMTETDIAATVPARVVRVYREEGDSVRRGDTLVTLTQSTLGADIDQRRARIAAAEADLRDLEAGARPAEVQGAQAEARSAEAEAERTQHDAERLVALAAAGHVSQAQLEAAQTLAKVSASRRDAAREALRLVQEGARPQRVQSARAAVASARAQLAMAEATVADLVLTAPGDGVVLGRYAEPGEVLPASVPAMSLGAPGRLWVRVYVPAPELARLRVGQGATVLAPGADRGVAGKIIAIASHAEFSPRVALTEKERADLLFGVKVGISEASALMKAGLPVTVTFAAADSGKGGE
ncbi:MAG: HlyD family efflux transporter periplasmic adaptor subunit [Gemmatimonadaceae bacterium]